MLDTSADNFELGKLRRFALVVGLVLLTYTLAGVELKSPASISPLGIPLVVKRPDLLGIGLVLASVYSGARYWFYGIVLTVSPMRARRRLKRGEYPFPGIVENEQMYAAAVRKAVDRYFPALGGKPVAIVYQGVAAPGTPFHVSNVTTRNRVLAGLENLDYTAPVWVTVLATTTYVLMWRWPR